LFQRFCGLMTLGQATLC